MEKFTVNNSYLSLIKILTVNESLTVNDISLTYEKTLKLQLVTTLSFPLKKAVNDLSSSAN